MTPRGRRSTGEDTRQLIVDAARTEFATKGYDASSLRAIARLAGVDPALVHHYFGPKADLFTAALDLPVNPADMAAAVLAEHPETAGDHLVGIFVGIWEQGSNRHPLLALIRSATSSEEAAAMLREFATKEVFSRVVHALGTPDAQLRANLVLSQLFGLAMARYIIKVEPIASMSPAEVVAAVGPTIQRYITGDLDAPADRSRPA
jgi:AcrR family transcriptional regulator